MKILINRCYGGFGLSQECVKEYARRKGIRLEYHQIANISRDDQVLIEIVEELGPDVCSGDYAELVVVEIPDDVDWVIEEYDGYEHIAEKHRTWPPS